MNVFQTGQPYMPVTAEQNGQQNKGHAGETSQLDDTWNTYCPDKKDSEDFSVFSVL